MVSEPSKIVSKNEPDIKRLQNISRYKRLYRITNEKGVTYIETPNKMYIPESVRDTFYTVEPGVENRLDLISYKFYNTPFLWWVIANVNHINNPMKVEAGTILRIPNMTDLYTYGGVLS